MKARLTYMMTLFAIASLILLVLPLFLKNYGVYLLSYWLIFVLATIGLNLILGYAGLKSLGHAAFMGIAAYIVAIMTTKLGFGFWTAAPVAVIACFVIGWIIGYPALRVQMHYLAFATIGFNEVVALIFRNEEWITGGTFGINNIARPSLFGYSISGNLEFYYFIFFVVFVVGLLTYFLVRSPWGKAFTALRDNPIRAESVGVNIQRYTLLAFATGSAIAGIAGCLLAPLVQYIEPTQFNSQTSILLYLMVVLGGSGYFWGPVLGGIIGVLFPEWLRFAEGWYMLFFGLIVILLMVKLPDGLLSLPKILKQRKAAKEKAASQVR
jgi:branched-chain amino acid transport system permease protein